MLSQAIRTLAILIKCKTLYILVHITIYSTSKGYPSDNCINKLSIKFQIHIRRAAARIFLAKNTKSNDPLSQLVGYAN